MSRQYTFHDIYRARTRIHADIVQVVTSVFRSWVSKSPISLVPVLSFVETSLIT